jgi:hypothetical protein
MRSMFSGAKNLSGETAAVIVPIKVLVFCCPEKMSFRCESCAALVLQSHGLAIIGPSATRVPGLFHRLHGH